MVWVVVPALNEAENLQILVPRIRAALARFAPEGQILVVDDGSTDGTSAVVQGFMSDHADVHLETLRRNLGKSAGLQRGFQRALDEGADIVVMMDADGQDDPEELGRLLAPIREGGSDLVTGARTVRRDRFVKRNTSRIYNATTRWVSGTPGRDFNSGYKAMRAEVVRAVIPMMYGEMHRYLTVLAHHSGYRVREESVEHHPRMNGNSKYGLTRFWRGLSDLVTVRFLLSYENRPSHLFGGLGTMSFLIGFLMLSYLTVVKVMGDPIGDRPLLLAGVLLVLVGLQLVLFGLLAELIVLARNRGVHTSARLQR